MLCIRPVSLALAHTACDPVFYTGGVLMESTSTSALYLAVAEPDDLALPIDLGSLAPVDPNLTRTTYICPKCDAVLEYRAVVHVGDARLECPTCHAALVWKA